MVTGSELKDIRLVISKERGPRTQNIEMKIVFSFYNCRVSLLVYELLMFWGNTLDAKKINVTELKKILTKKRQFFGEIYSALVTLPC